MRLLHTADWHLGAKLGTVDRLPEQAAALAEIVKIADHEKVDVILIAGDLFDNYHPANEAERLFYSTISKLTAGGTRPVIAIAGNHDSPDKIAAPDPLASETGILLVGHPLVRNTELKSQDGLVSTTKVAEGFIELKLSAYDYPLRIVTTPFTNEGRLKQRLEGNAAGPQSVSEVLQQHWEAIAQTHLDDKGVNVLIAHQFMAASASTPFEEDESERKLSIGGTGLILTAVIPPEIQYAALGHLHRKIEVQTSPMPVIYSSSLLPYSFSEAGQQKQVVIIDVEPGQAAQYKFIPLTAGRPLIRKVADNVAEALTWLAANQEALVELSVKAQTALSAEEVVQLKRAHEGIIGHPIPLIEGEAGVNDADEGPIHQGMDALTLFESYYKSRNGGLEPNQDLLHLFNELLAETSESE